LDTVGGALFEPAPRSLRFDGRMVGLHSGAELVELDLTQLHSRQPHVTALASVFTDGVHVARIFDQLRALFDHGLLAAPAAKTWPLEKSAEAYQTVIDESAGIKQCSCRSAAWRKEAHSEPRPRTSSRLHAGTAAHTVRSAGSGTGHRASASAGRRAG
jgi:hypothetical protein